MAGSNRKITIEFLGKDVSAGSTASKVEQKFGKLGGRLDRVGQAAGKVLVAGAVAGGVALYKMSQMAAEDEAAQQKLATAMRDAAGASDAQIAGTEKWITAQGKALGVADDQLRPALGRLVDATGDVDEAQRLAALAMDVSAGTGKDLGTVTDALVRAQNGSIGGLSRLGVKTKDTEGKTKSLKDVTADLSDLYGGRAAKAADTAKGRQEKLRVAMGELGEKIGTAVLPVLEELVEIGAEVTDWVSDHTTLVGTMVGVMAGLAGVLWAVSTGMRIYAASQAVATAVTALHNSAVLKNLATNVAYYAMLAGTGLVVLVQMAAATIAHTAATLASAAAAKVVAGAQKAWAAAQWLLNAAMSANPIGIVIVVIAALVAGIVIAYKKSETFRKIVSKAMEAVGAVARWLWNNAFQPALKAIVKGFAWVIEGIADMIGALAKIPGFGWAKDAAAKLHGLADSANNAADKIQKIKDPADRSEYSVRKLSTALQSLRDRNITVTTTFIRRGAGGQAGEIPTFAGGVTNFRGGLAVVGERGPELVHLPRGSDVIPNSRSMGSVRAVGGGGITINFNGVVGDPRATAREIRRLLLAEKRLSGANLGLA